MNFCLRVTFPNFYKTASPAIFSEEASVQDDVPKLEKFAKHIAHILDSELARLKRLSAKSAKSC